MIISLLTSGHTDIIQLLIRNGASVQPADEEGVCPVHLAAQNGHDDTVKGLFLILKCISLAHIVKALNLEHLTLEQLKKVFLLELVKNGASIHQSG